MFIIERLISTIAPHNCLSCGREGALLCRWCLPEKILPIPSRCCYCQAVTSDHRVCVKCSRRSALRHIWVVTDYDGTAKTLVQAYKFGRVRSASQVIAECMAQTLPHFMKPTTLVPIPSATNRQRQRGFDHISLITKALGRQNGMGYLGLLGRAGQSRQVGAPRQLRKSQLQGKFLVRLPRLVNNQNILLVDDVVTTGGTLEAAAKALKEAGAKSVSAVVFAQKL